MYALNNRGSFLFALILGLAGGRAGVPLPSNSVAPAPVPRTTHVVRMLGDEKGFRFSPAHLAIGSGDAVKFVVTSGAPHNVVFDTESIPADMREQLDANMGDKTSSLTGDLKANVGDTFTVSFAKIKPGKYPYYCTPHRAVGMTGVITVR
jgi:plastocyanin